MARHEEVKYSSMYDPLEVSTSEKPVSHAPVMPNDPPSGCK